MVLKFPGDTKCPLIYLGELNSGDLRWAVVLSPLGIQNQVFAKLQGSTLVSIVPSKTLFTFFNKEFNARMWVWFFFTHVNWDRSERMKVDIQCAVAVTPAADDRASGPAQNRLTQRRSQQLGARASLLSLSFFLSTGGTCAQLCRCIR